MRFPRIFKRVKHLLPIPPVKEVELEENLFEKKGSTLFLDVYTEEELFRIFEKKGITKKLKEKNLIPFEIEMEPVEMHCQKLTLTHKGKIIVELKAGECVYTPSKEVQEYFTHDKIECIAIEWLLVQNPFGKFSSEKPRLPGQEYPGIGISRLLIDFLYETAREKRKDCIIGFPEFYHSAVIYSKKFRFIHPLTQGKTKKMIHDLSPLPLHDVSFAFCASCILEQNLKTGKQIHITWEAEEMALPVSENMKNYFTSKPYLTMTEQGYTSFAYQLDRICYEDRREDILTRY